LAQAQAHESKLQFLLVADIPHIEDMQAFRAMMLAAFVLIGLVEASKISFDLAEAKKRPTSKVVSLLKGMAEQLEKEGEQDEKTYDEFKCWCKQNLEEKGKAVEEAQAHLTELKERVASLSARITRLVAETEKAEDAKAKQEAALDTATHLRNQQNVEYNDDKSRITGDIDAVTNALAAFASVGGGAFLQSGSATAKPLVKQILDKHVERLRDEDRETVQAFLQEEPGSQNDAVMGVLQGLQDEFKLDLKTVEDDEAVQVKQYEELKAAKAAEIQAGLVQIEDKKMQKAEAAEERANKKQEIKDTAADSGGDAEFAKEVETQCATMDKEWDERSQTRADETTAISKAIETLDSESSHDLFSKTVSFLQESASSASRDRVERASEVVAQAGKSDARMKALAMQMKLDNVGTVKKAMDEMVAALKKESADEVEQRDFCIKSFRENQVTVDDGTREKNGLVAKEASLKSSIQQVTKQLENLIAQEAELKKQLQLASQNREKENSEFQTVIADQRQTQVLLKQALDVLAQFYNKAPGLAQIRANPKAPSGFKDYKRNENSFGVMGMIRNILKETAAMETEGTRAEKSAQVAYEDFAKETTASVEEKEALIGDKKQEKAKAEKALVETRKGREGSEAELADLAEALAGLHDSCDFLMKNFDTRMDARTDEMDSIDKAKQILSGATFAEIQLN